jgi:uncharacterized protein DUF3761
MGAQYALPKKLLSLSKNCDSNCTAALEKPVPARTRRKGVASTPQRLREAVFPGVREPSWRNCHPRNPGIFRPRATGARITESLGCLENRGPRMTAPSGAAGIDPCEVAMRSPARLTVFIAGLLCSGSLFAKAPASAPDGTTGLCKDGSYSSSAEKSGACSGHGGVTKWYGSTTGGGAAHEGDSSANEPKSKRQKESAPAAPAASSKAAYPPRATASGGGNGQVWVNKDTKVYHCQGDKWYGKTKEGAYMTESNAVAQGYHADHGEACWP